MEAFCEPYAWGPWTDSFVTLCFTDFFLFILAGLVLVVFGIARFVTIRRFHREIRPYTKQHLFELGCTLVHIVLSTINFIYLIVVQGGEIPDFKYMMTLGWSIVWFLSLLLCEFEYQYGVKHGTALIAFWVISATLGGIRVNAVALEADDNRIWDDNSLPFIVGELVCTVLLSLNALVNNEVPPNMGDDLDDAIKLHDERERLVLEKREDDGGEKYGPGTPIVTGEEHSNLWNKLWFWWFTPLTKKGFYTALVHEDLPPVRSDDRAEYHAAMFHATWEQESFKPKPKLWRALAIAYWKQFLVGAVFKLGNDVFIFTGPILLEYIILFVNDPEQSVWVGVALAFGMLLGSTIQSLSMQQYWQIVFRIAMNVNTALISKVYSKALVLSHRERQRYTVGEITNLQAVDSKQVSTVLTMLHQIWSAPCQIIVSIALLWRILGVASLGGLAVMIGTSPLQVIFGKVLASMTKDIMMKKDKRIKLTNEILQGIRVIKFFAWEDSYHRALSDVRKEELEVLRKAAFTRSAIMVLWNVTPLLVTMLTFGIYVGMGKELTASVAFSSLALFNVMRFPLNIFPMLIAQLVEAKISVKRLEEFFKGEELDPNARQVDPFVKAQVAIEKGDFEWNMGEPVLKNIDISIPRGSLVAVVGEVGSGKSSLLSAILGEMPKIKGRVIVNGSLAYVPQTAWMKNDTLRENILFGKEENKEWYKKVIKCCQLEPDLSILPANDKTEIGEKGINLSGGQKQRVSMARAIYNNADIYLLDDPLSAVDAHVGKALFNKCIRGLLKDKTRILATHQLQYLRQCDQIIVFSKGQIANVGTYEQLMRSKEFNDLISKHVFDNEDAEEEEFLKESKEIKQDSTESKKDAPPKKEEGKLIVGETKSTGGVSSDVYIQYGRATGSSLFAIFIIFVYVASQASSMVSDYWLSAWSANATETNSTSIEPVVPATSAVSASDPEFNTGRQTMEIGFPICCYDDLGLGTSLFYLMVYGAIGAITTVLILARSFVLAQAGINASQEIHDNMLNRILHVPTSYFDTVPIGRIVNRFSSDQNTIDVMLPRTLGMALDTILVSVAVVFVIASATPVFLISLISLSFLYRYAQTYYLRSSREIQRLASLARSPIFALFSESLTGLSTIRAYDKSEALIQENLNRIERYNQADYMTYTSNRWLGAHLEFLGSCIVFAASFFAVISRSTIDPGVAGLSISYALRLTSNLNWLVRMSTDVENNLISVERCLQFTQLDQEAAYDKSYKPPASWPARGAISFRNLSLRYREGLPLVLDGVSADIKPSEKIGVVGRTGAGKSSLMLALFRVVEPCGGSIVIDGEDLSQLGLRDLRSSLAIIPQEATLFSGTIRSNLTPFGSHDDNQLWDVLEQVGMKDQVKDMPNQLDEKVSEFGENISVGSRQLLCLARAILRKNKVLVMDEATANVDFETDAFIQKTIRRSFKDVTVLTIAHRVNTILDSDRVMVLDKGQIIEFDNPQKLLSNPKSVFFSLAKEGGVLADYMPGAMPVEYSSASKTMPRQLRTAQKKKSSSSSSSSLVDLDDSQ